MYKAGILNFPSHIWNVDEPGCQHTYKSEISIGETGKPGYNIIAGEKGKTTTALVCVNAVPPTIIHKGMKIGKLWTNGARYNVTVRTSESGYVNKEIFLEFGHSHTMVTRSRNLAFSSMCNKKYATWPLPVAELPKLLHLVGNLGRET